MGGVATFTIAAAGTSLVVYVLMSAKATRGARRSSAGGDGSSNSTGDSSGDGWAWVGSGATAPAPTILPTAAVTASGAIQAEAIAAAARAVAAAGIDTDQGEGRRFPPTSKALLDSFQSETRISLELLQKGSFPFASDRAVQ